MQGIRDSTDPTVGQEIFPASPRSWITLCNGTGIYQLKLLLHRNISPFQRRLDLGLRQVVYVASVTRVVFKAIKDHSHEEET